MESPVRPMLRFRERVVTFCLKAVFPRVTAAEIMLFFFVLFLHAVSYVPKFLSGFTANIRRDYIQYILNADGLLDVANALFAFILPGICCLWAAIVVPLSAVLLLVCILDAGFSNPFGEPESASALAARYDKKINASFVMYYYLAFALASGYLLYQFIKLSGLFPSVELGARINYAVLWLFFIRQIICALVVLFGRPDESIWGQDFLSARLSKQGYHWLTLTIGLIAAAVFYMLLRRDYSLSISAVIFAFIYAHILIMVLEQIIIRVPPLAECAPPIEYVKRLPVFKKWTMYDPTDRETRPRTLKQHNIEENARCPACGSLWRIDATANLDKGAFVPCPRCKARLMPLQVKA